tara:strand:+ start:62 stop:499 length:438 start_codon:yes stop_codon:yes gene_type:complete
MSKIYFEKTLSSDFEIESLLAKLMDFESHTKFMPAQLKSVKILKNNDDGITTEETISFKSIIKKTFIQQTLHRQSGNSLYSKIISGPARNTKIFIRFEESEGEIRILVDVNLKLSLSVRILEPLVKKYYKTYFNAFLNRLAISTI